MPRGDGTGPAGMGAMTGRGAGYCNGFNSPGFANFFRAGFGRGMGFGRGLGRMFSSVAIPTMMRYGYNAMVNNNQDYDEKTVLKNEAQILEEQLKQVKDRLKTFEEE